MIPSEKLDFWIENSLNVLLIGKIGVGKSSIILNCLEKKGIKYIYFSGPTLDPWVDFVGIPKEKVDGQGEKYIDYIRPKWHDEDIEGIFIDELNRSPQKIHNALLELIQFKSINQRKFPKLRFIWSAINPLDESKYSVEELDDAIVDRFHIHYNLPYLPDYNYFHSKFGENGEKIVDWWSKLSPMIQNKVSPRRLEYAIRQFEMGGDLDDVLPMECLPSQLKIVLNSKRPCEVLDELLEKSDEEKENVLSDTVNLGFLQAELISKEKYHVLVKFLPEERISTIVQINDSSVNNIYSTLIKEYMVNDKITSLFDNIIAAGTNNDFCKKLKADTLRISLNKKPLQFNKDVIPVEIKKTSGENITSIVEEYYKTGIMKTTQRLLFMRRVFDACENKKEQITEALRFYEGVASKHTDDLFIQFTQWLDILNNHLKQKLRDTDLSSSTCTVQNTQDYLKRFFPCLFNKIARLPGRLCEQIIEIKVNL